MRKFLGEVAPVMGETPDADPEYGRQYRLLDAIDLEYLAIQEEVAFDTVMTFQDGTVDLLHRGVRVATCQMTNHHADASLVVGDPKER